MFESNALQDVVQLDVHAEIVRIQFQLVARSDSAVFSNVHRQRRYWTVKRETPMLVSRRIGLEINSLLLRLRFLSRDNVHEILLQQIRLQ